MVVIGDRLIMKCKFVADDFEISSEINQAILVLVENGVITKTGIMQGEYLAYNETILLQNIQTGLHINLTIDQWKNKKTSPVRLLYLCYIFKKININQLSELIHHQAEFIESKGFKIDYFDTHQHVHILPMVLKALILVAKKKGIKSIRCITMKKEHFSFYIYSLLRFGFIKQIPELCILYFTGYFMKRYLDKNQINYCDNLVLMPLAINGNYSALINCIYSRFKEINAEIITHPGLIQKNGFDEYVEGRKTEYETLLSFKI